MLQQVRTVLHALLVPDGLLRVRLHFIIAASLLHRRLHHHLAGACALEPSRVGVKCCLCVFTDLCGTSAHRLWRLGNSKPPLASLGIDTCCLQPLFEFIKDDFTRYSFQGSMIDVLVRSLRARLWCADSSVCMQLMSLVRCTVNFFCYAYRYRLVPNAFYVRTMPSRSLLCISIVLC